jgi:hypothetical protein
VSNESKDNNHIISYHIISYHTVHINHIIQYTIPTLLTYIRKGNFGRRSLLQEHTAVTLVEQKDGKGAVQNAVRLFLRKDVRLVLGRRANNNVAVVEDQNGILLHEITLGQSGAPWCFRCTSSAVAAVAICHSLVL